MKGRRNEGFTLLETLIAIVVLGLVVVPTCSSMLVSFRMNAKTDQLLQDQLAVSSAVETLLSRGIMKESDDYGWYDDEGTWKDEFPEVQIVTRISDDQLYYNVIVTTGEVTITDDEVTITDDEVTVTTQIRAVGGGT